MLRKREKMDKFTIRGKDGNNKIERNIERETCTMKERKKKKIK